MKKLFIAIVAVSFLSLPAIARAEDSAAGAAAAPAASAAAEKQPRKKMSFEEKKAKIATKLQKHLSCVQAAQTPEALRACGGGKRHHRGGKGKCGDDSRPQEPKKQNAE